MKIIDCRLRPPFGNYAHNYLFEYARKGYLQVTPQEHGMTLSPSAEAGSMKQLLIEMEEAGITQGVFPIRPSSACGNELLEPLYAAHGDRFLGFAGLSPREGTAACLEQIEQYAVKGKAKGISLEPALDTEPWYADDPIAYPLYEVCRDKQIPIIMTFGGRHPADASYYLPMAIEHVARDFPELTLILCHGGWPWVTASCSLALNYKRVFLCADMYLINAPGHRDYIDAANYFLQDKLLFGSAYPILSIRDALEYYQNCGIQAAVLPKIMYANAERALNL